MSIPQCKYERTFTDSVPMPFGPGSCSMESSECVYEGDKEIPDDECFGDERCPAYEPVKQVAP